MCVDRLHVGGNVARKYCENRGCFAFFVLAAEFEYSTLGGKASGRTRSELVLRCLRDFTATINDFRYLDSADKESVSKNLLLRAENPFGWRTCKYIRSCTHVHRWVVGNQRVTDSAIIHHAQLWRGALFLCKALSYVNHGTECTERTRYRSWLQVALSTIFRNRIDSYICDVDLLVNQI